MLPPTKARPCGSRHQIFPIVFDMQEEEEEEEEEDDEGERDDEEEDKEGMATPNV